MSALSVDRETYGPSWFEILVVVWLSVLLGGLLAAIHLIFKPINLVTALPKDAPQGEVFFIQGNVNPVIAKGWQVKQQLFASGQSVSVVEEELNAAFSSLTDRMPPPPPPPPPAPKPKPGAKAPAPTPAAPPPAPVEEDLFVPGQTNYRIADGMFQVALPVRITFLDTIVQLQIAGRFEPRNGVQTFVPDSMHVGSLPVHLIPALPSYILGKVASRLPFPADFMQSWAKVKEVTFDGRQMNIVVP